MQAILFPLGTVLFIMFKKNLLNFALKEKKIFVPSSTEQGIMEALLLLISVDSSRQEEL